jgi:hypothetical protein
LRNSSQKSGTQEIEEGFTCLEKQQAEKQKKG